MASLIRHVAGKRSEAPTASGINTASEHAALHSTSMIIAHFLADASVLMVGASVSAESSVNHDSLTSWPR